MCLLHRLDCFVSFALLSFEHGVGFLIVFKQFGFGIPLKLSTKSHRNVGEMAGRHAPVLAIDVGNGLSLRLNTIEKIPHVIDDRIEFARSSRSIQVIKIVDIPVFTFERLCGQIFYRGTHDLAAIDKDTSGIAGE